MDLFQSRVCSLYFIYFFLSIFLSFTLSISLVESSHEPISTVHEPHIIGHSFFFNSLHFYSFWLISRSEHTNLGLSLFLHLCWILAVLSIRGTCRSVATFIYIFSR
ncbi:hypothetical protein BDF14DRAFT_364675 [Spinellus fusiger]|nr:hypothetical protein BDF14DRAFT_364675 [Spinellus fusiger]